MSIVFKPMALLASCCLLLFLMGVLDETFGASDARLARAQDATVTGFESTTPQSTTPELPTPTTTETPTDIPSASETAVASETPTPTEIVATETPSSTTTPEPSPTVEVVIDSAGGSVVSPDGNATLTFPPDATNEPLLIRITSNGYANIASLPAETNFLSAWDFEAFAINRGNAEVDQFAADLTVELVYEFEELFGVSHDVIRYWIYDELSGQWTETPTTPTGPLSWSVTIDHFSSHATSGDGAIQLPPSLDAAQVNPSTGSVSYAIPLKVAPGRGGLAPALNLTYDSARVDDMAAAIPATWVGIGWDLSMPFIARQRDGTGGRYFLNLNGVGGELIRGTTDKWLLRDQQFLDITHSHDAACDNTLAPSQTPPLICPWTIRDQAGNVYVFGSDEESRRYYSSSSGVYDGMYAYQWDVRTITNVHGDVSSYEYDQVIGAMVGVPPYVFSSYPEEITYPGGRVSFLQKAPSELLIPEWGYISVRSDAYPLCGGSFVRVFETRALAEVKTESTLDDTANPKIYGQTARYVFDVQTPIDPCGGNNAKLASVETHGTDLPAISVLNKQVFNYTAKTNTRGSGSPSTKVYDRLSEIKNGFGGEVDFTYQSKSPSINGEWSRWVALTKTTSSGFNATTNPPVTLTYAFSGNAIYVVDGSQTNFRGFDYSDEKDAANVITRRWFIKGNEAVDQYNPRPAELAGRPLKTELIEFTPPSQEVVRQRTQNWYESTSAGSTAYFNTLKRTRTTEFYGGSGQVESEQRFAYDSTTGQTTAVTQDGDSNETNANVDCRRSTTSYYKQFYNPAFPTRPYLVLPDIASLTACPSGASVSETKSYYDGVNGLPFTRGNLTATRTLADTDPTTPENERYVYSRMKYDAFGNQIAASVPRYGSSAMDVTGNSPYGDVWTTFGRTETAFSSVTGYRFPSNQTTSVYNPDGSQADPFTQSVQFQYDARLGMPTSTTAVNGLVANVEYDEFGRVKKEWSLPDTQSLPTTEYVYDWRGGAPSPPNGAGVNFTRIRNRMTTASAVTVDEVHCSDGLGRETQAIVSLGGATATGGFQRTQRVFNTRGLLATTRLFKGTGVCSATLIDAADAVNTNTEYDTFRREKRNSRTAAGLANTSAIVTNYYAENSQLIVDRAAEGDASGQVLQLRTTELRDDLGRVIESREYEYPEPTGGPYVLYSTTKYDYDVLANLTNVTGHANASDQSWKRYTDITYDAMSRKRTLRDPDMSGGGTAWKYRYDAAGNLIYQRDARLVETFVEYDSLSRLRKKSYYVPSGIGVDPMNPTTFTYDRYNTSTDIIAGHPEVAPVCNGYASDTAIGSLTIMSDERGNTRHCYDPHGRETAKRRTISGEEFPFDTRATYDSGGRVISATYPDGDQLEHAYDDTWGLNNFPGGKLIEMTSAFAGYLISDVTYAHATGAPTRIDWGNGYSTTYDYSDPLFRLKRVTTSLPVPAVAVQDVEYAYSTNDNVKQINDFVSGENVFYNYDTLNRIKDMRLNSATGDVLSSYTYGAGADLGKLVAKDEGGVLNYSFTDPDHVHAVTKAGNDSFTYDKNGNISSRVGGETYKFDAENRMVSTATYPTQTDYWYDGSGKLLRRFTSSPQMPGTVDHKVIYVDGVYEKETQYGGTPVVTKYYSALGRVIAQRRGAATNYQVADHLGSTTGMILATGDIQTTRYYPFGKVRSGGSATDKMYTNQQMEGHSRLGAYYYQARFYSPTLGHFLSADPYVSKRDSVGINRFAYARNNPLVFVDATGYEPTEADLNNCASNLTGCFSLAYGQSPNGLVIVMGLGQGLHGGLFGGIGDFWGYSKEFLRRFHPGCASRASECWDAAQMLMEQAGPDAVYDVFGIMFIESDPGGRVAQGASGIGTDRGRGALEEIVGDPRGKSLKYVIGASLGAVTVSDFFADNTTLAIPFFLDSPPLDVATCLIGDHICHKWVDYNEDAEDHQAYAGKFPFFKDCGAPIPHCVSSSRADEVFDLLADKARELGR